MAYPVARYAAKYNIPLSLANALVGQESGGSAGAVSNKGATGLTQVMPATAAGMYGISEARAAQRLKNPQFALDAGFRYLAAQKKAFGSWRLALAAYNAGPNAVKEYGGIPPYQETQDYVRSILGKALPGTTGASTPTAGVGGGSPAATSPAAPLPQGPNLDQFALNNLAHISAGDYNPIKALEGLATQTPLGGHVSPSTGLGATGDTFSSPPPLKGPWKRYVTLAPTADRAGVHTSSAVLQFVGSLGRRVGRRLTIGTGTNHNEFVVGTQRESAHWTGHAADIPASGSQLTRLGQAALIQAGMSPREARKQKGGLFNIGHWQVIFQTHEGGDHTNHLHVGYRG